MPSSRQSASTAGFDEMSAAKVTMPREHPVRTSVESARPPKARSMLSISRDFPAPVSPVNALNPGDRAICACSRIAIFWTVSSKIMAAEPQNDSVQSASHPVEQAARRSLAATVTVVLIKLVAAGFSGSVSVLAEATQSLLDVVVSFGVLQTVRLARKPPDEDHPYGHGKVELVMSAAQMVLVLLASGVILYQAVLRFMHPKPIDAPPGAIAMVVCIAIDFGIAAYLTRVARRHESTALAGEAVHLRSDAVATIGVLLGLVTVGLTHVLWLDPALAGLFTLISIRMAAKTLVQLVHPLLDGALPREEIQQVEQILAGHPHVRGYHNLRTRKVGSVRYVELHALLDDNLSFPAAHDLAEKVEDRLREALAGAVVTIHYEPYEQEMEHQRRAHHRQF